MNLTTVKRLRLRWILLGIHLLLYIALVILSGWPPHTNPYGGPDRITPLSLRLAFAINLPAWIVSNGIQIRLGPETNVDPVVVVGALLLPQWWIIGRWAETRSQDHYQSGIALYFWGSVCLASMLMLVLLGYEVWVAHTLGVSLLNETGLAAALWLLGIMACSARETQAARRSGELPGGGR
jgi:hypothetical protein